MLSNYAKQLILGAAAAAIVLASSFAAHAEDSQFQHHRRHKKTNINLAVASNFYGNPPTSSAITDIIAAFEAANPRYTVNWLRVLDTTESSQVDQRVGHQLHAIMPLLDTFETE